MNRGEKLAASRSCSAAALAALLSENVTDSFGFRRMLSLFLTHFIQVRTSQIHLHSPTCLPFRDASRKLGSWRSESESDFGIGLSSFQSISRAYISAKRSIALPGKKALRAHFVRPRPQMRGRPSGCPSQIHRQVGTGATYILL